MVFPVKSIISTFVPYFLFTVLLLKSKIMEILFNGKGQSLKEDGIDLLDLFIQNKVQQPDMVSVQLNGQFVNPEDFGRTAIKDGDEIDFLYFMGGGQR
jgi:sulfur carrier protein